MARRRPANREGTGTDDGEVVDGDSSMTEQEYKQGHWQVCETTSGSPVIAWATVSVAPPTLEEKKQ